MTDGDQLALCMIGEHVVDPPQQAMQEAALAATGRQGTYEVVDVDAAGLLGVVRELRAGRWRGANVGAPYQVALAAVCDSLDGDALRTGAVNTLTLESDGRLVGDNTNAAAFELALSGQRLWPLPDSRALVVGSGPAAAAVTLAMSRVPALRTTVVARRINAARSMVDALAAAGAESEMAVALWDEDYIDRLLRTADIVVNATTVGLDQLPFTLDRLQSSCTVVDVRYRPRPVDLVAAAAAAGLRSSDGVDMLLHQGMLSFRRWTGEEQPPYAAARAALDQRLGG